jgi:hypothetical protein
MTPLEVFEHVAQKLLIKIQGKRNQKRKKNARGGRREGLGFKLQQFKMRQPAHFDANAARAADAQTPTTPPERSPPPPSRAATPPPPPRAVAAPPPAAAAAAAAGPAPPEPQPWPSLAEGKGRGGKGNGKGNAGINQNSISQWDLWWAFNAGKSKGVSKGMQHIPAGKSNAKGYGGKGKGKGIGMYGRVKAGKGNAKPPPPPPNPPAPPAAPPKAGDGAPAHNRK